MNFIAPMILFAEGHTPTLFFCPFFLVGFPHVPDRPGSKTKLSVAGVTYLIIARSKITFSTKQSKNVKNLPAVDPQLEVCFRQLGFTTQNFHLASPKNSFVFCELTCETYKSVVKEHHIQRFYLFENKQKLSRA